MFSNESNKERIKSINQMLIEIANGNFAYKIPRISCNDDLETAGMLLNMMAEELREFFHHYGYVNPTDSYKHIAQLTFTLDENLNICGVTPQVYDILLFKHHDIVGRPFARFLTEESRAEWNKLKPQMFGDKEYHHTVDLSFKAQQFFIVPVTCSVSTLLNADNRGIVLVTAIETVLQSEETERKLLHAIKNSNKKKKSGKKGHATLSGADIEIIQEARDYITRQIDQPSFSLKNLGHTLGTNQQKLKIGFKQLYGTTMFSYLIRERLRTAQTLLRHTQIPIKVIAEMTGFKTAPHFTKVFKKKLGYTPSELREQSAREEEQ
ncbi:helix-turn-helix transcriptional regulator [Sinomicrobium sp. M5D2P17]